MEHSASKRIFVEAIEQIEKWSKIITFLSRKVIPLCGILTGVMPSFFFYFVTDLGDESFGLPVPMW